MTAVSVAITKERGVSCALIVIILASVIVRGAFTTRIIA
jgi:hypothetical protein